MKKSIAVLAMATLLFSSCKKEKKCGKTMPEVAGTYSYSKIEMAPVGGTFTDVTSSMPACIRDNKFVLNTDSTASYNDEGARCGGGGSGHWRINADGSMEINVGTINYSDAEVVSYDCSTIVFIEIDDSGITPIQYKGTITK